MNNTDYPRGLVFIRRHARGAYAIHHADGALLKSYVPNMREAEKEAARLDAQQREIDARNAAMAKAVQP
jgi:hypothetical protein